MESKLPEAKAIFEKKRYLQPSSNLTESWDKTKITVEAYHKKYEIDEALRKNLKPRNLLKEINSRFERLDTIESTIAQLVDVLTELTKTNELEETKQAGTVVTTEVPTIQPQPRPTEVNISSITVPKNTAPQVAPADTEDSDKKQEPEKPSRSA